MIFAFCLRKEINPDMTGLRQAVRNLVLLMRGRLRALILSLRPSEVPGLPQGHSGKHRRRKKIRAVPLILGVMLGGGFISGYLTSLALIHSVRTFALSGETTAAALHYFFGKSLPLTGPAPDGSFVLTDLESEENLKAWYPIGVVLERSDRFPSQGKYTAKATFLSREKHSIIVLDDLLKSRMGGRDWRRYKSLAFTLYAPVKEDARISLQITDVWGDQYRETLKFPGGQGVAFDIPIEKIGGVISLSKIDAVAFVLQDEKEDREFYLDDLRLTARGEEDNAAAPLKPVEGLGRHPVNFMDYGFAQRKPAWTLGQAGPMKDIIRIPFMARNETPVPCRVCSVEGGMPFPKGELQDAKRIRLRDSKGDEIPVQTRVLSEWPDGSVRWLFLNFEDGFAPWQGNGYFLDYGIGVNKIDTQSPLRVREDADAVEVDTGALRAVLSRETFFLFEKVFVDENADGVFEDTEKRLSEAQLRLKFKEEEFRTDLSKMDYTLKVEESGPLRAVVRAEGWFKSPSGKKFCKAVVRYTFYQGKSHVKIAHTLIYTGYPANRVNASYARLKLPENEPVGMFGIRLPMKTPAGDPAPAIRLGRVQARPFDVNPGVPVRLHQKSGEFSTLKAGEEVFENPGTFGGWIDVSSGARGLAVSVRRFRENYPKGLGYDPASNTLDVDLWPEEQGELDLSTTEKALGPGAGAEGSAFGLAKTHELLLYFHRGDPVETAERVQSFSRRLLIRNNPFWVDATGVLGRLYPEDSRYQKQEKMLGDLFAWADRHPRMSGWYGMVNFGDTLTEWRDRDETREYGDFGWHPFGRWGWANNEGTGTHSGALLQFVRTGQWKYFDFGENLARHLFDIDTIHYNTVKEDPRLRNVLNEAMSQPGSMHASNGDHWGGRSDQPGYSSVFGILLYYYLTGDERAWESVQETGEFYLRERFTYVDQPDTAPGRGLANALWGSVLLYQVRWDERYKNLADKLIEIFLRGQKEDGSFPENYHPKKGVWSGEPNSEWAARYHLGAFIAYHEMTQDPAVKDMILKLVRYLGSREDAGTEVLHGLAYAYLISKDPAFIDQAEKNLDLLTQSQRDSDNPLTDGMIFDKPAYHQPNVLLYTVPYVFGAFEEYFAEEQKKKAQPV